MLEKLKAFFAAIIAFFQSLFGIGGHAVTPAEPAEPVQPPAVIEEIPDEEYFSSYFTPVLRFAIATDTHIMDGAPDYQVDKLKSFYQQAYAYADRQTEYRNLDGIFFAGDNANKGSAEALKVFFDIADEYTREGTVNRAVIGNHEYHTGWNTSEERFLEASGYDSTDADMVIGGFHIIALSTSEDSQVHYNTSKQQWLDEKIAAAVAGDPTGRKPVFVFQHIPPLNTVMTSDSEEATPTLNAIFEKYPQVIDFSGHTHSPQSDPRAIWQGGYTEINIGSGAYYGGGIAGICEKYVYTTDNFGGCNAFVPSRVARYDGSDFMIVEVDRTGATLVIGLDSWTGLEHVRYYIRSVGDPSKFRYGENRPEKKAVPSFENGAEISILSVNPAGVTMSVPQAKFDVYVEHYRFDLYNQAGEKLDTVYALSDRFYAPAPAELHASFRGLQPETRYNVKCTAVSSYCMESSPLEISFTTPESQSPDISDMPVVPDVFSLGIGADGIIYDAAGRRVPVAAGAPSVSGDGVVFNGESYLKFYDIGSFYSGLQNAFTLEFYGKYKSFTNSSGYVNPLANFEKGGFGFQTDTEGETYFSAYFGNGYVRSANVKIPLNEYVHLAGTYDGINLNFYCNGELISSSAPGEGFAFTSSDAAKYLCIGGDSNSAGTADGLFTGTIKGANVYSRALSADEISAMYSYYSG